MPSTTTSTRRVGLYARISDDRYRDESGVQRQVAAGRDLIDRRGWTLVAEYVDNDVTASKGRQRERYAAMCDDVRSGRIDGIVFVDTDRLTRTPAEGEAFMVLADEHRIALSDLSGDYDLSSSEGRFRFRIGLAVAAQESEKKAERVTRKARELAHGGHAGGPAPYGWRHLDSPRRTDRSHLPVCQDDHDHGPTVCVIVDPPAAAIVRECVARLIAGDPLGAIARDLNTREVPPPAERYRQVQREDGVPDHGLSKRRASGWHAQTVRSIVRRPANVGQRVHQGEVIGDAAWDALVSDDDHARVLVIVNDAERAAKHRVERPGARQWLLTHDADVAECGRCARPLRVAHDHRGEHVITRYRCVKGCTTRRRGDLDKYIRAVVVARLSRDDARDLFSRDGGDVTSAQAVVDRCTTKLARLTDLWTDDRLTDAQFTRASDALRAEQTAAQEQIDAAHPAPIPDGAIGSTAGAWWDAADVATRRALLETIRLHVTVWPDRRRTFDPASVDVTAGPPARSQTLR